jgi:hypothetical protein
VKNYDGLSFYAAQQARFVDMHCQPVATLPSENATLNASARNVLFHFTILGWTTCCILKDKLKIKFEDNRLLPWRKFVV